ncbi:IS110 family transposase [Anaerobacillus isosaccharinicus]|uniref:IS110 family transposase n=1 Tax=Anaerobacillus isosaccharinicus TaxID=1532552 RepID=A0A1S2KZU1_9BACI|nr:IS110 family transposase [Anaerobacillus isosaccharinicus]MBA5584513.1 IS110 family transposase [Anaerobacillus isosaccharinicus]QOY37103.1 IS110 family transposase [Anaerobacillus isosaccharinicus]
MEIIHERVCGLDVHKKTITACILATKTKEIRTFGTMTEDLFQLIDWIKASNCTIVAMESTGVYWKPIYNLLEVEEIETLVVNAQHIKNVPGRKSDVRDAQWIAQLLRHGLVRGSYIPNRDQRELRELVRYRRSLVEEITRESNRVQKVLEGANIKLGSVASDVLGVSGRRMLKAIVDGETDPTKLADLSLKKLRNKIPELQKALKGLLGPHQRFLLRKQLDHIEYLEFQVTQLDTEVANRFHSFEEDLELLASIPGVGRRTAEHVLAEIGTDMTRFKDAKHLVSWAGLAPGQNESAGKRKTENTRKGNKYLRSSLAESAKVCAKTKTFLGTKYHRIAARRGKNRATIAVAANILKIMFHLLTTRKPYTELGEDFQLNRKKEIEKTRAIKKLEKLGFKIEILDPPA